MADVVVKVPREVKARTEGKIKLNLEFLADTVIGLMKRDISERYKKTGEITDEDWRFCEKIDWHPVDELPPKKEHIEELRKRLEEIPIKFNSVEDIFKS